MTDPAPLTDEELATLERDHTGHGGCNEVRLIAALRASRAENERMRAYFGDIQVPLSGGQDWIDMYDNAVEAGLA